MAVTLLGAIHVRSAWNEMQAAQEEKRRLAREFKLYHYCREFEEMHGRKPTPEEQQAISENLWNLPDLPDGPIFVKRSQP